MRFAQAFLSSRFFSGESGYICIIHKTISCYVLIMITKRYNILVYYFVNNAGYII